MVSHTEKHPMPGPVYFAAWLAILAVFTYAVHRMLALG
jgi:hypothetical protein